MITDFLRELIHENQLGWKLLPSVSGSYFLPLKDNTEIMEAHLDNLEVNYGDTSIRSRPGILIFEIGGAKISPRYGDNLPVFH